MQYEKYRKERADLTLRSEKKHTQKYFSLYFTCGFNNDLFHPLAVAFYCLKKKSIFFSLFPVHSQS